MYIYKYIHLKRFNKEKVFQHQMLNGIFAVEKINSEVEDEPWKIQWKSLFSASRPHIHTLETKKKNDAIANRIYQDNKINREVLIQRGIKGSKLLRLMYWKFHFPCSNRGTCFKSESEIAYERIRQCPVTDIGG